MSAHKNVLASRVITFTTYSQRISKIQILYEQSKKYDTSNTLKFLINFIYTSNLITNNDNAQVIFIVLWCVCKMCKRSLVTENKSFKYKQVKQRFWNQCQIRFCLYDIIQRGNIIET